MAGRSRFAPPRVVGAMTQAESRRRAERRGRVGEHVAALLLTAKFYRIVARRFRASGGEIDLVARRGASLVFVEVKARATIDDALCAIGPRSRRRITDAARAWTQHRPRDGALAMRFDVIAVAPWRWPRHIVGAFESIHEDTLP